MNDFAPGSTRARGDKTEELVVGCLPDHGLVLIERNATIGGAEIDLIARSEDGTLLVFIEVRGRRSDAHGTPVETVDARKQGQITRAATAWLVRAELWERVAVRFDVVGVLYSAATTENAPTIQWIEGAFEAKR